MSIKLVRQLLSKVLLLGAALLLVPIFISALYGDGQIPWFALTAGLLLAAAFLLSWHSERTDDKIRPREGFVAVALSWILLSFFGALPFVYSGWIPSLVDAFFEVVSGYTTTGATILTDVEALPPSLLFWRSFTHWVGGMGVLVLVLALVPRMGARSLNLLRAESPGPSPSKLVPKIGESAKILYGLYMGMTLALVLLLVANGMNLYDAFIHAFGTAGTGGFSNYNDSIGHFQSASIEIILSVFLILFSINFTLYYQLMRRNWGYVRVNSELRTFLSIVAVSVLLITIDIYEGNLGEALRASLFQVASIVSTAGFVTRNFAVWPLLSRWILILLMLMGACAGSTGGGVKVIRVNLMVKNLWREIKRTIHPRSVSVVRADGGPIPEDILHGVAVFFFGYIFVILSAILLVSFDNLDFETTTSAVLATVSNIGPGLSQVGPIGNFAMFSPFSKLVLSACMLIGRLDIYPILMLFSLSAWKKNG